MLSIADIELLFARHGTEQYSGEPVTQLEARAADRAPGRAERWRRRARHRVPAARPRPPAQPPGRDADAARHRRHAPVLRAAVPARALPRRGARRDQAARRRQALSLPRRRGLLRAPLGRLEAQPRAAGRRARCAAAAVAFLAQPGARDAVLLRQWDDLAKQADLATPSLVHFLDRASACVAGARR